MKYILQLVSSFILIRLIVKAILYIFSFIERIWSNLKYRSVVKDCSNSICHHSVEIKYGENISVGQDTRIGAGCTLGGMGGIQIGKKVVVSKNVIIETAGLDFRGGIPYQHMAKKIVIKDNVWIGANVMILGGVEIGENSVLGAGVVVSKSIGPNKIVVGQPVRILDKQ